MNPEFVITLLRWSVPICFGLHVIEELVWPGGFIEWYHAYRPKLAGESRSYYYIANAVYFSLTALVPFAAHWGNDALLFTSGLLLSNLIFTHIRGAMITRQHSPGIVTGCLLYVPLFVFSYSYLLTQQKVTGPEALICLALSPVSEIYFALKNKVQLGKIGSR